MAAELTTAAQVAVPHIYFVFLTFQVSLKLFGTGEIRVTGITTRPWRFLDRSYDGQFNHGNRARGPNTIGRRRSRTSGRCGSRNNDTAFAVALDNV